MFEFYAYSCDVTVIVSISSVCCRNSNSLTQLFQYSWYMQCYRLSTAINDKLTVINACSLLYVREVYIQGESSRETEAWFDLLNRAMEVGLFSRICLHI